MMPFNWTNPHSILILDNCSVHHIPEVKHLLKQSGILAFFLPPYSPDLNPLEEAFSYVKAYMYLKRHDDILQSGISLREVIKAAFDSISELECNSWITDSGYCKVQILPWLMVASSIFCDYTSAIYPGHYTYAIILVHTRMFEVQSKVQT